MLWVLLVFLAIVSALVVTVYRVVARWGRGRAVLASALALLLLLGGWPLPIHGGFVFFAEEMFDELWSSLEQRAERRETRRHEAFVAGQSQRLVSRMDFVPQRRVAEGWSSGRTPDGSRVWLDETSGLVWSDALPLASPEPSELLARAGQTCADHPPRGHWALPTDAEGFHAWRNGAAQVLPPRSGRFVSQRIDTDFELALPIVHIVRPPGEARSGQDSAELPWRVRCVALGERAPRRGYLDLDVAREDWNAYQVDKLR